MVKKSALARLHVEDDIIIHHCHHHGPSVWCLCSAVDAEGEKLLRVHVVEGPEVGELEQDPGEAGRVAMVMIW